MTVTPAYTKAPPNSFANSEKNDIDHLKELINEIAVKRDRQAFIEVFNYYAPRLKSFLMRGGFNPDLAEELMQETLLSVWNQAASYNPDKALPGTWIYTIARNKKIDYLRKNNKQQPHPEDLPNTGNIPDPISALSRKQDSEAIIEALKTLPKDQSDLLVQAFYEDKSHSQIAEQMDLPLGTVKSRIRLALQKLRAYLDEPALPAAGEKITGNDSHE